MYKLLSVVRCRPAVVSCVAPRMTAAMGRAVHTPVRTSSAAGHATSAVSCLPSRLASAGANQGRLSPPSLQSGVVRGWPFSTAAEPPTAPASASSSATSEANAVTPAAEAPSFASLGVHPALCRAAADLGLTAPTEPQVKAIPAMFSGKDVLVTAETGSGKTLAYLLPVLSRAWERLASQVPAGSEHDASAPSDGGRPDTSAFPDLELLVVVPTQELALQVAGVARQVLRAAEAAEASAKQQGDARGGRRRRGRAEEAAAPVATPLLSDRVAEVFSSRGVTKRSSPVVIVGTPAALCSQLSSKSRAAARVCVLDEADLLLSGSHADVVKGTLLAGYKILPPHQRPQVVFVAATMPAAGKDRFQFLARNYLYPRLEAAPHVKLQQAAIAAEHDEDAQLIVVSTDRTHKLLSTVCQRFLQLDAALPLTKREVAAAERDRTRAAAAAADVHADSIAEAMQRRVTEDREQEFRLDEEAHHKRLRDVRNHALLCALVPGLTFADAPAEVDVSEPADAVPSRSEINLFAVGRPAVTRASAAIGSDGTTTQTTQTTLDSHRIDELTPPSRPRLRLTKEQCDQVPRTLVFVNSVEAADDVRKVVSDATAGALPVAVLHKRVSDEQRAQRVANFSKGGIRVLVCTDLVARGLDTVWVEHVIQAEFATDAVSFLHRAGRTARAGRTGRMTCFLVRSNLLLAQALLRAAVADSSIDDVFSVKRSLRKRSKREAEATPE